MYWNPVKKKKDNIAFFYLDLNDLKCWTLKLCEYDARQNNWYCSVILFKKLISVDKKIANVFVFHWDDIYF